jgi:transcriptional regulator with XRE-family HTH domain
MKERLQKILTEKGLSAAKFAEILQIQRSNVSHVLSGRNNPGYDFIKKIMEHYPDINPEWLILGNGSMYKKDKSKTYEYSDQPPNDLFSTNENQFIKHEVENKKSTPTEDHDRIHSSNNNSAPPQNQVERIVIFYKGNIFKEYKPRDDDGS